MKNFVEELKWRGMLALDDLRVVELRQIPRTCREERELSLDPSLVSVERLSLCGGRCDRLEF